MNITSSERVTGTHVFYTLSRRFEPVAVENNKSGTDHVFPRYHEAIEPVEFVNENEWTPTQIFAVRVNGERFPPPFTTDKFGCSEEVRYPVCVANV